MSDDKECPKLTVETIRKMKEQLCSRSVLPKDDYTTFSVGEENVLRPACVIYVYEDLARPAHPFVRRSYNRENMFEIHVPKRQEDMAEELNGRWSLLSAWCHEIGHVLAAIFHLPATMRDPRGLGYSRSTYGEWIRRDDPMPSIESQMYESEQEAWAVADMLIGYQDTKVRALRTYDPRLQEITHLDWSDRKIPDTKD